MKMMQRKYIDSISLNETIPAESYLSGLSVVQALSEEKSLGLKSNVTFFIGENGSGKSTLMEAIAVAYGFNPEGGTKNFNFATKSTHSDLYKYLRLSRSKYAKDGFFYRAESFYNVASNIEELDGEQMRTPPIIYSYGGISLHAQSHGESLLSLVQNRFGGNGLYILDEPEAALSPARMMTLMAEINNLEKNHSQFIIATHSPILMTYPNACIYQFTDKGVDLVDYKDTEHYQITKRFLENPEKILGILLGDKE